MQRVAERARGIPRRAFFSPVLVALALVTVVRCGGDDDDGADRPTIVTLGPEGGEIAHRDARVTVPAGALAAPVDLAMVTVAPPRALPDGREAAGAVFSIAPHGQTFDAPVTVELPYDDARGGLAVWTLDDPDDPTWERVSGALYEAGRATFMVDHLSLYVVGAAPDAARAVVATITVPGADPVALLVDAEGQLVVFDAATDNDDQRPHLRFVAPAVDDARGTIDFVIGDEALPIAWTSGPALGWMVADRHHGLVFVVGSRSRTTQAGLSWDQLWVHVVSGRAQIGAFNPNPDGGAPAGAPVDYRLAIAGLAVRQAQGDAPSRLVLHDIVGGDLEIIDLDPTGTAMAAHARVSLRPRLEEGCTWPPAPPPHLCEWRATAGNTLAYARRSDGELVFVIDPNTSASGVTPVRLSASSPLMLERLHEVDLADADIMFANGVEGLTLTSDGAHLWVAAGLQSFEEGFIGTIDVATLSPGVVRVPYHDRCDLAVDPSAPDRVFVAAADAFAETPALLVHELMDGALVGTTRVLERYDGGRVASMAWDPDLELLYMIVGEAILVVRPE